jgi:predicted ATPase
LREIGSKLVELRATTSLARLLAPHSRTDEAHTALAPLYATFTEGFDRCDLRDAKACSTNFGRGWVNPVHAVVASWLRTRR